MVERSETTLLYQTDRHPRECQVRSVDPALRPITHGKMVFSTAGEGTHVINPRVAGGPGVTGAWSSGTRTTPLETILTSPTGA